METKITKDNYDKDIYYTSTLGYRPFKIVDWKDSSLNDEGRPMIVWYRSENMKHRSWTASNLRVATEEDLKEYDLMELNGHLLDDNSSISLYKEFVIIGGDSEDQCVIDNDTFEKMIEIFKKGYQS